MAAALDAVLDPATNQVVCRVTLVNPAAFPGCAPLNLFGPTSESPQALAYVTDYTLSSAHSTQDEFTASITGAPFGTWAGPVNMALSAELRRSGFSTTSQVSPDETVNCALLPNTMNCSTNVNSPTNLHQVTFRIVSPVSQTIREAAIESDLPLMKDVRFAQAVNVNLAARYADYASIDRSWTWKVGLDWHLNDQLRVRATRSRDFRAPTLNDLYAPATISRGNFTDQLTNQQLVSIPSQGGGNPDLQSEIGHTWTGGFVYQPRWLQGLSLTVDAYRIEIENAFANLTGSNATVQRLCIASGGTSPYCDLIVRPLPYTNTTPANNATKFYNVSLNAASTTSHGLDIESNYSTRLFNRSLSLRLLATWQPELRTVIPGFSDIDQAGSAGTPEWRLTGLVNLALSEHLRANLSERWRSPIKWNADPSIVFAVPKVPSFATTNLNLTYSTLAHDALDVYVNVQNLFDREPPLWTAATSNPGVTGAYVRTDDFVGRYFTAGLRLRL